MVDNDSRRMTFARALFDNIAEMPRELSFKKGDILTVLQEKYENNPEWWVCSLRNMVGLAPANRLEAMPVLVSSKPGFQSQMSASAYDELPEQSVQEHNYFNIPKINTLTATDDTYSNYQVPREDVYVNPLQDPSQSTTLSDDHSIYQLPSNNILDETYSNTLESQSPATPKENTMKHISSKESLTKEPSTNEYYSNRCDYSDSFSDATSTSFTDSSVHSINHFSLTSSDSGEFRSLQKETNVKINLSQDEAVVKFRQLQTEVIASCNKVIEFAKAKWKSEEVLKMTIYSLQESFLEFNNSLIFLINFAIGVYQNSLSCPDVNLTKKLGKHISPLQESRQLIKDALEKLDVMNWDPEVIATSVRLAIREGADAPGQIVSAARNVLINVRSLSVTINGNASILFPSTPKISNENDDKRISVRNTVKGEKKDDEPNFQNILKLFSQQVLSQVELVNETVDDFVTILSTRTHDSHFKDTVSGHSKFVVRSATQLVCIAKNLSDTKIKSVPCDQIEDAGNRLCDSLKAMINITKQLISERKCSSDQKEHLLRQLKLVKSNARNLRSIVVSAVS